LGFRGSGSEISSASLYTVEASGKGLVEAFTSENYFPFYLYWTPDSQSISFLSNGVTESGLVLHLVPATGGVSSILGVGQPFYWAWSPDSDRLIIHTGGAYATNPDAQLAFLSLDNEHENSSLGLIPAAFQAPDWSTDGERIVVASQGGDGQRELVLTGRDGAQQQVLATFVGMAIFSISPNSRMLAFSLEAFVADNPGGLMRDLFVMDLAPGAAGSQITQDLILGFFWSPDSSKIAYYAPVLSTPGSSKETAPMPVELRIGLFTLDVGTWEINRLAIFSPTDPFLEILPFYDQYQRSVTIWSPDSSQIVFTGIGADGEQGVYVVRADGSAEPQRIASGGLAFWSWK
jgi:TolB protein